MSDKIIKKIRGKNCHKHFPKNVCLKKLTEKINIEAIIKNCQNQIIRKQM